MSATAQRLLADFDATTAGASSESLRAELEQGLPTPRDENWRYTSLRALERAAFRNAPAPSVATLEAARALLPPRLEGVDRIVLVDGHFATQLSEVTTAVTVRTTPGAPALPTGWPARATDGRFASLNAAFSPGAVEVTAAAGTRAALEVCCVTMVAADQAAAHPRLSIAVAPQAELVLIERHVSGADANALTNLLLEANVEAGARLQLTRSQQHGPRSQFFESLSLQVARDAQLELAQVTLGALTSRTTARIDLREPGAQCGVHAALLADASRSHDAYVRVEHHAPHTQTREIVRGIAADRARVAFNGHILMAAGAVGAQSEQSLRGLLSGAQCEIDLRPQLEIYVDAVKASHGATTGKLDENMLFYLLSRGLDRPTAQSLLKWAFVADVMTRITDRALRTQIERDIAARLTDVPIARELA